VQRSPATSVVIAARKDEFMIEYEAQVARKLQRFLVFSAWLELLAAGGLTTAGLRHVRAALDSDQFSPGPEVELMKLIIDEALAEALGVRSEHLPGRSPAAANVAEATPPRGDPLHDANPTYPPPRVGVDALSGSRRKPLWRQVRGATGT
jgi:hypothetical protein